MVSVAAIVPCFNGEPYLADALASIRAQTRPADEVIVVDDGSTDDSARIAESFGAVVFRQRNGGEAAARNRGIQEAGSDLVAWLDADDRWRPRHLEVVAGLLERTPSAVAAFGAVERTGTRGGVLHGYVPPDVSSSCLEAAFDDWLHTTIASVTRRAALLQVGGFDVSERHAVDFDIWLRLARRHRFTATHEVTSEWRWHSAQQSSHLDRQLAAVYRYRRRFLATLRAEGEEAVAEALERRLASVWIRDVRVHTRYEDRAVLRLLRELGPTIPTLSTRDRVVWSAATRAPALKRRAADAQRWLTRLAGPRAAD
ncbi:glycosyltransferase family 2 protein [Geodermatophilus sp. SYSU D00867]